MLSQFFALHHPNKINISVNEERKLWFKQFIKSFAVVFLCILVCIWLETILKLPHRCSLTVEERKDLTIEEISK